MVNPIQISFRGMDTSKAIVARIQKRAAKLERHNPGILSCRVVFEQLTHRHQQGNLFNVRIDVAVAGAELVANQGQEAHGHEDPWVAVREAFDRMDRLLEEHNRKHNQHLGSDRIRAIDENFGVADSRRDALEEV